MPQFALSLVRSLHVPALVAEAPQIVVLPAGQLHTPLAQLAPEAHAFPHAEQLAGSLERSTHAVPHVDFPVGHAHTPAVQT